MRYLVLTSRGFTLIELLITTVIIAVLAGITIPFFQDFSDTQQLSRGLEQVKTDLRTVQNRAVSAVDRISGSTEYYWWGLDLDYGGDSGKYALLESDNETDPNSGTILEKRVKKLPGGLSFDSDVTIWFRMISGEVCTVTSCPLTSDVTVRVCKGGGNCRELTVSPSGAIDYR